MVHKSDAIRRDRGAPRGVVALWTLLMIPVLVVLFAVVVEGVHLWLARVELENALEAAALAAAKEWGETPSGPIADWTENARLVGQQYAKANTINQTPVSIGTNFDASPGPGNPNENLSCNGNLIFGTLIENDPENVFVADQTPSCVAGGGRVLVEATSNNLTSTDNAWGISFPTHPDDDAQNIVIDKIVIDIDPNNTGRLRFDFSGSGRSPILSASKPTPMVSTTSAEQADNYGFVGWMHQTSPTYPRMSDIPQPTNPSELFLQWPGPDQTSPQIQFSDNDAVDGLVDGIATQLTITFHAYSDGITSDSGFNRGDRFRFGAGVVRVGGGGNFNTANGDDIGSERVKITVYFRDTTVPAPPPTEGVTSYFTNTAYSGNQCGDGDWEKDDLNNWHLIVHPIRLLTPGTTPLVARDLPCPLTSAANNDKQSIVMALGSGTGVGSYVVRAQSTHTVPSLICGFMGIDFGPFTVSACTTAMYDCELQRPRLIRVEEGNFHCPTTPPP